MTLERKQVLGLSTTLSLCKTSKDSLQGKATSMHTNFFRGNGNKECSLVNEGGKGNILDQFKCHFLKC